MRNTIFLLTQDGDSCVDTIMLWLQKYSKLEILRINETDRLSLVNLRLCKLGYEYVIKVNDQLEINSNNLAAFYYRRGDLKSNSIQIRNNRFATDKDSILLLNEFTKRVHSYYVDEWNDVAETIFYLLKNDPNIFSLNSFFDIKVNKLINLKIATDLKINIPSTLISNDLIEI